MRLESARSMFSMTWPHYTLSLWRVCQIASLGCGHLALSSLLDLSLPWISFTMKKSVSLEYVPEMCTETNQIKRHAPRPLCEACLYRRELVIWLKSAWIQQMFGQQNTQSFIENAFIFLCITAVWLEILSCSEIKYIFDNSFYNNYFLSTFFSRIELLWSSAFMDSHLPIQLVRFCPESFKTFLRGQGDSSVS